jgi:hypothetical protein
MKPIPKATVIALTIAPASGRPAACPVRLAHGLDLDGPDPFGVRPGFGLGTGRRQLGAQSRDLSLRLRPFPGDSFDLGRVALAQRRQSGVEAGGQLRDRRRRDVSRMIRLIIRLI